MRRQGFSLIELMVVIAIISLIAIVAFSSFRTFSAKGKWAEVQPCLSDVAIRLENYRSNHGVYPNSGDPWSAINLTSDCSEHYEGAINVFNDGASYIIAFRDSKKSIWNTGEYDVWAIVDSGDTIYHVSDPVTGSTQDLPAGYSLPF